MKISFLGAAGEVTGSCFLVETHTERFIVDCGMFQGAGDAARKNRHALDFDVSNLDFVLLTHAHLDHSGLLPRLVAFGYQGPIYCTAATANLLVVMLADAATIQERESEWRKRAGKRYATAVHGETSAVDQSAGAKYAIRQRDRAARAGALHLS